MEKPHLHWTWRICAVGSAALAFRAPEPAGQAAAGSIIPNRAFPRSRHSRRPRATTSIMRRWIGRLQRLMEQRVMVGLAVGVVENGRITFLKGYGETLAGSGDPVTPETVFRWASVSKGVAATMVGKLAEQGKVNLDAPVANYVPTLKLPAGSRVSRDRRRHAEPPAWPLSQRLR